MDIFDRTDLLKLGGGTVVSFAPQAFYDLRCYYEAMEMFLASSHSERLTRLRAREEKLDPKIRAYLLSSDNSLVWEDYFPSELRASVLVSIMSFFERYLDGVCTETQILLRTPVSHKQLKGNSIDRARTFLMDICSLSLPTNHSWETMKQLQRVRNILVHNGGIPDTPQAEADARRLTEVLPGFTYHELGNVLEAVFIRFALDSTSSFLDEMAKAIALACDKVKKFEREA
jgi:hypothetical protein